MLKMELPGKRKVKNKVYGISKRSTKNERKMKKMKKKMMMMTGE